MSKIIVSSSSNSDEKEIDKDHNESRSGGSSDEGDNSNEQYLSTAPRIPLKVFQEEMRTRMASGSLTSTSANAPSSTSSIEKETLYCCAVGIPSKIDEAKLNYLRRWYQFPDDLNPRLVVHGEWCCNPCFGVGIYEAYLLVGLRLPLNAFSREILNRLGIGINQLHPNAWRLIIFMQIFWREVFDRNRSLTMDEFQYYYKPLEISQSLGIYQFFARGSNYRLVRSLPLLIGDGRHSFSSYLGFGIETLLR